MSNYGLGQIFLTYKEIASQFQPDYVLILINEYLMERTIEYQKFLQLIKAESFNSKRPIFKIDKDGERTNFIKLAHSLSLGPELFFKTLGEVPLRLKLPKDS